MTTATRGHKETSYEGIRIILVILPGVLSNKKGRVRLGGCVIDLQSVHNTSALNCFSTIFE